MTIENNPSKIQGIEIERTYEKSEKTLRIMDWEYLANL